MVEVTPALVEELLGAPRHLDEALADRTQDPGVAIGLAWTPVGGDVLLIEASRMAGGSQLTLTGSLGDVMKESARIALSWFRAHASSYAVDPQFYKDSEIHLHVPSGAIPKDGPSAGVTMVVALASALSGRPVRGDIAMTGEVTLSGRVLPVGGMFTVTAFCVVVLGGLGYVPGTLFGGLILGGFETLATTYLTAGLSLVLTFLLLLIMLIFRPGGVSEEGRWNEGLDRR